MTSLEHADPAFRADTPPLPPPKPPLAFIGAAGRRARPELGQDHLTHAPGQRCALVGRRAEAAHVAKAVGNLAFLRDLGQQVNRKLLEVERLSHHCVLTQDALDRLQRPTDEPGQRVCALRFGDPRVMALCQAISGFTHLPRGFRNRDLRPHVEALLGRPYSAAQMTYDLRPLRLKGLIHRIRNTHRYTPTSHSLKGPFFYAKLYLRILRPNWAALLPEDDRLPRPLRAALDQLDREIQNLYDEAALAA